MTNDRRKQLIWKLMDFAKNVAKDGLMFSHYVDLWVNCPGPHR